MLTKHMLAFSLVALMSTSIFAQTSGPKSPQAEKLNDAPTATTSLLCYFKNAEGNVTWQWGLAPNNSWYQLNGAWQTTQYTKLQKFFTTTNKSDLDGACNASLIYYKLAGYTQLAYFASDKSAGYTYPIVANGVELFPQY